MANYYISKKTGNVIISGALTAAEESIVALYMKQGHKVVAKTTKSSPKVKKEHIIAWLEKNDKEAVKAFEAEAAKKIKDKNGKERKAGYLVALSWFKEKYPKAMEEIKESLKED